ncbi:sulfite exporter TauE/SafE family protein [Coraliomargarita parva]|uniref:sulfite exporter TauE/SafE family protein n=1 Tax=Coraliomargarita parva TaxID=3014050 RepID=UPI0022B41E0D|nr:sulfite exporter TauE/SafE family protein [Coraliomargarita parva]
MFEYQTVYNGYTALLAGLVTSVHCVGMCGPLSCAFAPARPDDASPHLVLTSYHLSKLLAYACVGALAGAFGSIVVDAVSASWLNYIPWVLVVFFISVAFRLDRFLPKPKWLGSTYRTVTQRFTRLSKPVAAAVIGLATPLLPCGPLYMIFGLALFSGSAFRGAEFAVGFGLGTLPLLWLAQSQFMRLNGRLSPVVLSRVQRSVALIAALVVAWRLRTTLGIEGAEDWVCHPF